MLENTPRKISFVNGKFDLIHLGHLTLLKVARSLGDFVVVYLDSNDRIVRNTGKEPVMDEWDRRAVLNEILGDKGNTVIFDEDKALLEGIYKHWPNYVIKGSDYSNKDYFEKKYIQEKTEATIIYVERTEHSSSNLKENISNR